jgi:hypothetical protein
MIIDMRTFGETEKQNDRWMTDKEMYNLRHTVGQTRGQTI